jgi:hypothetical protein
MLGFFLIHLRRVVEVLYAMCNVTLLIHVMQKSICKSCPVLGGLGFSIARNIEKQDHMQGRIDQKESVSPK